MIFYMKANVWYALVFCVCVRLCVLHNIIHVTSINLPSILLHTKKKERKIEILFIHQLNNNKKAFKYFKNVDLCVLLWCFLLGGRLLGIVLSKQLDIVANYLLLSYSNIHSVDMIVIFFTKYSERSEILKLQ